MFIVWIYIICLTIICLLTTTSAMVEPRTYIKPTNIVFYGDTIDDIKNIKSSVTFSIEKFRETLSPYMIEIDKIVTSIREDANNRCSRSKGVNQVLNSINNDMIRRLSEIPIFWEKNEELMHRIIKTIDDVTFVYSLPTSPNKNVNSDSNVTYSDTCDADYVGVSDVTIDGDINSSNNDSNNEEINNASKSIPHSYDSVDQLLIHLLRDWSSQGKHTRESVYGKVLTALKALEEQGILSQNHADIRVFMPGIGLGRLAVELASIGYNTEGNESSGLMIITLKMILDTMLSPSSCHQASSHNNELEFYPYLNFPLNNDWDIESRFKPSVFPSIDSRHLAAWIDTSTRHTASDSTAARSSTGGSLSIQYGDFLKIYNRKHYYSTFDIIVSCFFIDTAADLNEYLSLIVHLLKPGGIFINTGPLHYHFKASIPYSYADVLRIVASYGFTSIYRDNSTSSYVGDADITMKPTTYHTPIEVFQLKDRMDDTYSNDDAAHDGSNGRGCDDVNDVNSNIWKGMQFTIH